MMTVVAGACLLTTLVSVWVLDDVGEGGCRGSLCVPTIEIHAHYTTVVGFHGRAVIFVMLGNTNFTIVVANYRRDFLLISTHLVLVKKFIRRHPCRPILLYFFFFQLTHNTIIYLKRNTED